jgi:hypothetical protein
MLIQLPPGSGPRGAGNGTFTGISTGACHTRLQGCLYNLLNPLDEMVGAARIELATPAV